MTALMTALMTKVLLAVLLLLPLAGCGGRDDADPRLTVLAAASLTEAFSELADEFEAAHTGVDVELSFGSSTELAETVADQAPGDVLATADQASMAIAEGAGATSADPVAFATNTLVIVTAPGNPTDIDSLDDLAGTTWVRCADDVPCGRVALSLLDAAGVTAEPASLEVDVRSTLEKVTSGEVDAGLVYASDATAAGDAVDTVEIPGASAAPTTYFLAPLTQSADAELAAAWVSLVTSDRGRAALSAAGFGPPPAP
jgi:molybdate transport system substrate-binding protein